MLVDDKAYVIKIKHNPWYLFFKGNLTYKIEYVPVTEAPNTDGEWSSLYKLFRTYEEAQSAIPRHWANHNHPLLVYLHGFFNIELIIYRYEWTKENGISFWDR